jgi:NAD(P)H-dependent FMN reductase
MSDRSPESSQTRGFNVAGIAGSLRRNSYNRALLRAAAELASPSLNVTVPAEATLVAREELRSGRARGRADWATKDRPHAEVCL